MKKIIDNKNKKLGFTIIEIVVVIAIIGILAAISFVAYSEVTNKAVIASLTSDLDSNADVLELYYAEHNGVYPSSLDTNNCPSAPVADTTMCLKASSGTTLSYSGGGQIFMLTATKNSVTYQVTDSTAPAFFDPWASWITIGTQTWVNANLNVGTMVDEFTNQTNNGGTNVVEKYCYDNLESNCTTYGGLYIWDEAMQYVTTEGAQGICPAGSHIPSDNDWKTLEKQLGMTQLQADAEGWRGTDQGTQLKSGGTSGLNMQLAGYRVMYSNFGGLLSEVYLWSSTEFGGKGAMTRYLSSTHADVSRAAHNKSDAYPVRCVRD